MNDTELEARLRAAIDREVAQAKAHMDDAAAIVSAAAVERKLRELVEAVQSTAKTFGRDVALPLLQETGKAMLAGLVAGAIRR